MIQDTLAGGSQGAPLGGPLPYWFNASPAGTQEGAAQDGGCTQAPAGGDAVLQDAHTHERQRLLPSLDAAAAQERIAPEGAATGGAPDAATRDAPTSSELPDVALLPPPDAAAEPDVLQPEADATATAASDIRNTSADAGAPAAAGAALRAAAGGGDLCVLPLSPLAGTAGIVTPGTAAPPVAQPAATEPTSTTLEPLAGPDAHLAATRPTPKTLGPSAGPADGTSPAAGMGGSAVTPAGVDAGAAGMDAPRGNTGKENAHGNIGPASDKRKSGGKSGCACGPHVGSAVAGGLCSPVVLCLSLRKGHEGPTLASAVSAKLPSRPLLTPCVLYGLRARLLCKALDLGAFLTCMAVSNAKW